MDYRDFGARLKSARKQQHLTQEQLAEKMDISPSFLGHVERGTRVFSLEMLVKVCTVLNISADYLLQGSIPQHEPNMPQDLTPSERAQLRQFLRLAQETVNNWYDK